MRRRLLVLALVFGAVYGALYVVTEFPTTVAVVVTVAVAFFWIVALDLRRRPWPSKWQRSHDAAYAAATIAAFHASGPAVSDCPASFDGGFSGGADCGGGGV